MRIKITHTANKYILAFLIIIGALSCGTKKTVLNTSETTIESQQKPPSTLQVKYGKVLGIVPDSVTNINLYAFIDDWMETPYRLGGETEKGIDCSSFTQLLYGKVFDLYIERTAHKQFTSKELSRFRGKDYLKEGDLLFFQSLSNTDGYIDHVGIYLANDKFVHSTSYRGKSKKNGVQISDLRNAHWEKRFVAAGKRKDFKTPNLDKVEKE